jgi:hypothetical protein
MNNKPVNLNSTDQQARLLLTDNRQSKLNLRATMLERSIKQIGGVK